MHCPSCSSSDTQVIDSRDGPDSIRRRRECLNCQQRFTTYERPEQLPITVIKRSGDHQRFDPEKIRFGVKTSCKNRPITSVQIDTLVQEVSQWVYQRGREEITSKEIGSKVQELLKELDPIAYLRFTSVCQAFANLQEFETAIHAIH